MTPNWSPLDRELDHWAKAGLTLPLWWRDDDAIEPTKALDFLSALSAKHALPVHLAIIPAHATQALAEKMADTTADPLPDTLIPVVHGWAHQNHAPQGEKKAEFGPHRGTRAPLADAADGLTRLSALFGPRLRPMFVPPWNRIAPQVTDRLPGLGFTMLSTFTPRKSAQVAPGLVQINTHLDPIDWKTTRSLVDPNRLIDQIVTQLQDRRIGHTDASEPYGLLTHHLAHDAAIWDFTDALLSRLMAGPVTPWTAPAKEPA